MLPPPLFFSRVVPGHPTSPCISLVGEAFSWSHGVLGCCLYTPTVGGDDDGFFFRLLAIAVAFFGTVGCVQLFASAGSSGGAQRDHQW